MESNRLVANRILHVLVLTGLAVVLVLLSGDLPQIQRLVIGFAPIATWMLGQQYERAIVLDAGVIDADELSELERDASRVLFRNR